MKNSVDVPRAFTSNTWFRLVCTLTLAFILASALLMMPTAAAKVIIRLPVPGLSASWGSPTIRPVWPSNKTIDLSLPFGAQLVRATGGLTVTKSASSSTVDQGGLITYTLQISNETGVNITDITVTDTVPANTDCVSINDSADGKWIASESSCDTREVTWLFAEFFSGVFASGSAVDLTYTVVADQPLPDQSQIVNAAFSYGVRAISPTVYADLGPISVTTTVNAPHWAISKAVSSPVVQLGDVLTYTIRASNDGHLPATGLYTITDEIPQYTDYLLSLPPATLVGDNGLTWAFSETLAVGGSRVVTYVVQVTDTVPLSDGWSIVNAAYSVVGGNVYTGAVGVPVEATVQAPDLHIAKSDSTDPIWAGGILTYTLAYSNSGGADAAGVVISDTIDGNSTFVGSSPSPNSNVGDTYFWNISSLTTGESDSIIITVSVASPLASGTLLTNTASISAPPGYAAQATETTVAEGSPTLHLVKEASTDVVEPGDLVTYTLSYSNSGNAPAVGVRISDTIDSNTVFQSATPGYTGGYVWDIGPLWPSDTYLITLTVRVTNPLPNGTILINEAVIRDSGNISDTDQAPVTVESAPILHLVKEAITDTIEPGDALTYTIWYSNTGNAPATGVVITDDLPLQLHLQSADPAPSGDDQQQVWDIGTMNVGGPYSITLVVTSDNAIADLVSLTNQVTLSSVETTTATAQESVTVRAVELEVDKTASSAVVKANEFITYTITVVNSGHAVADQVRITDTLPISIVQGSVISSTSPGLVLDGATSPPMYVWTTPTLDPLAQVGITISGRLTTTPWTAGGDAFSNAVWVTSEDTEVNLLNNNDEQGSTGRPGDPFTITLAAVPTQTDVGNTIPVTASVTDQWGNPAYDGETVVFDSSLGVMSPGNRNTQDGMATSSIFSTLPGTATVTGTVGGIDATALVTFTTGAPHHFVFTPNITSPQTVGVPFSVTVIALDLYDNPVTTYVTPTALADQTGTVAPTNTGPGWINGVWTGTVTLTGAVRDNTITATNGLISGTSNMFDVQPGPANSVTLEVTTPVAPCGATSVHTATVRDAFGNAVWAGTDATFDLWDVGVTGATLVPSSPYVGQTDDWGLVTATVKSSSGTGIVRLEVDIDGDGLPDDLKFINISGIGAATDIQIEANPSSIPVENTSVLTTTLRDCTGVLLAGTSVELEVSGLGGLAPISGPTNAQGVFSSTFTAGLTPGTAVVTATSGLLSASTPIIITGGPVFALTKTSDPQPGTPLSVADTVSYLIVVTNTGTTATDFVLTDPIPANSGYVPGSLSATPGTTLIEGDPLRVEAGSFGGLGEVLTVTFAVTATGYGDISNQASIDSDETDPQTSNLISHSVIPADGGSTLFLPLLLKGWPPLADVDLVVQSLRFVPGAPTVGALYQLEVVIRNEGSSSVTTDFFVELYLNPRHNPPSVGQAWQEVSQSGAGPMGCENDPTCYGRAWQVTGDLGPGATLTLSTDPALNPIDPQYDRWPADGAEYQNRHTPIIALVDSFGAVSESNETNNLSGALNVSGLAQELGVTRHSRGTPLTSPNSPPGPHPVLPLTSANSKE